MRLFVISILLLMVLPMGLAFTDLGVVQQDTNTTLSIRCSSGGGACTTASCNYSIPSANLFSQAATINYNTILINLTETDTNTLGRHDGVVTCVDGLSQDTEDFTYEVTTTGRENPTEFVFLGFIVGGIALIFYLYLALALMIDRFSVSRISEFDFDVMDLAKVWGLFFAFLVFWGLHEYYVGMPILSDILNPMVIPMGTVFMLLPLFLFVISLVAGGLKHQDG